MFALIGMIVVGYMVFEFLFGTRRSAPDPSVEELRQRMEELEEELLHSQPCSGDDDEDEPWSTEAAEHNENVPRF